MVDEIGTNCKEIHITIPIEETEYNKDRGSYNVHDQMDLEELEAVMLDLKVG